MSGLGTESVPFHYPKARGKWEAKNIMRTKKKGKACLGQSEVMGEGTGNTRGEN